MDQTHLKKRHKKLLSTISKSIYTYDMINHNDRIMVAVSGGKDSISLLYLLLELKKRAPIKFDIFAYTLDQAQPGFDATELEKFYQRLGVEYYIEKEDTYSIVIDKTEEGGTYCSLCSRLRRGILYHRMEQYKATKLALGHHADDALETLILNLFYSGRLAAISPKLLSDDGKHTVIRPLIEINEDELEWFSGRMGFPIIPCNLCNNQDNLERQRIKAWFIEEQKRNKIIKSSMKSALKKVELRHLWNSEYHKTALPMRQDFSVVIEDEPTLEPV